MENPRRDINFDSENEASDKPAENNDARVEDPLEASREMEPERAEQAESESQDSDEVKQLELEFRLYRLNTEHYVRLKDFEEQLRDAITASNLDDYLVGGALPPKPENQPDFIEIPTDFPLVIGREPGQNGYTIPDIQDDRILSRRHVEITTTESGITIRDLNSSYGTDVNSERIPSNKDIQLSEGDVIELAPGTESVTTFIIQQGRLVSLKLSEANARKQIKHRHIKKVFSSDDRRNYMSARNAYENLNSGSIFTFFERLRKAKDQLRQLFPIK